MGERLSISRSLAPVILAALFGATAGIAGAALFSTTNSDQTLADRSTPRSKLGPVHNDGDFDVRLRKIERDILAAQDDPTRGIASREGHSSVEVEVPREVDQAPTDVAAQIVMEEDLWIARVEAVENEPVDEPRAKSMSESIKNDYDALIKSGNGTVRDLVCKTNRCKMEIDWGTSSDMLRGSKSALHARTAMSDGCARHVRREEESLRSIVIFECEDDLLIDL